ncbi:hypothetical protein [Goodfellowiella coeruleoviolacea]|uniref:Uncharacterized protein n=1 Tax=Goodfellowiella coeruleoviolacea TaxID=334858 RepID=A0AAE3GDP2_9PSEU|nr:hypothetical protein [Goodfellowiella coeruleoviolacea]MCP2166352.1 hypothetical protein [Goodfellowiella coeruleoviolacea]
MRFRFGRNAAGRVTVEEAGDGSDDQYFVIAQFLEEHMGDTLDDAVNQARNHDELLRDRAEWGFSGNTIALSIDEEGAHLWNLFIDEREVSMTHEEFIELVSAYVQELEHANDPRSATNARQQRVQSAQDDA